jgi:hypothetical protein
MGMLVTDHHVWGHVRSWQAIIFPICKFHQKKERNYMCASFGKPFILDYNGTLNGIFFWMFALQI